jgi:histidyl-tRNA synthetase
MVTKGIDIETAKKYLKTVLNLQPNDNIKFILDYLKKLGFSDDWYSFEPTLARSFSYSSGPIWEVKIPGFIGGSVLGGERFDGVVKKISGLDIAATGFGLGFDRTLEALTQFDLVPDLKTSTKIMIANFGEKEQSLKLASFLRENNINTLLYPTSDKIGKQFKYASAKNIPFVALIGSNEAANNEVTIKNMSTGEQITTKQSEIIKICKVRLY